MSRALLVLAVDEAVGVVVDAVDAVLDVGAGGLEVALVVEAVDERVAVLGHDGLGRVGRVAVPVPQLVRPRDNRDAGDRRRHGCDRFAGPRRTGEGRVRRSVGVLKKRMSDFEKRMREFQISEEGILVGDPLLQLHGIMTGLPAIKPAKLS